MSKAQGIAQSANQGQFKNRIINGAMMIDQRNAGASVTPSASVYTLDRWRLGASVASKVSVQQSSVAPVGFKNSVLITSLSSYTITGTEEINFGQRIEGFNTADLGFGTANAQPVTFSFWVRSSLTGTFSGCVKNQDANRSYVFSYTILAANTWEQKSITIAGDTTGTWLTDASTGILIQFCIASASLLNNAGVWYNTNTVGVTGTTSLVGTNGATFYITGVQLEKGSTATSFDYRPYGTELALCQRYYWNATGNLSALGAGVQATATIANIYVKYPQAMRASPTLSQSGTFVNNGAYNISVINISTVYSTLNSALVQPTIPSGYAVGTQGLTWLIDGSGFFAASAEL
jgi:hypothetical protein